MKKQENREKDSHLLIQWGRSKANGGEEKRRRLGKQKYKHVRTVAAFSWQFSFLSQNEDDVSKKWTRFDDKYICFGLFPSVSLLSGFGYDIIYYLNFLH